jgi:hypothetical protein
VRLESNKDVITIFARIVNGDDRQGHLDNRFAPEFTGRDIGFEHEKAATGDAFQRGETESIGIVLTFSALNGVQLGVHGIGQKPNAGVTGDQVIKPIKALAEAVVRPDFALPAPWICRDPDVFAWLVKLVEKSRGRPIPTAELAPGLEIILVHWLSYPPGNRSQIFGLIHNVADGYRVAPFVPDQPDHVLDFSFGNLAMLDSRGCFA